MDVNTLISELGLPIAMVVYLIWEKQTTMKKLTEVVESNTQAILKLCENKEEE